MNWTQKNGGIITSDLRMPVPFGAPSPQTTQKKHHIWQHLGAGLLSSSVIVVLFLSNTSDADGIWWMFCFITIIVLDWNQWKHLGVVLQKGGLGIETLRVFWHQVAFLVRWVFKFLAYTEPNCWWKIFLPREITAMTFGRENVQGKIHGFILHIAKNHWSPQLSFHEQK